MCTGCDCTNKVSDTNSNQEQEVDHYDDEFLYEESDYSSSEEEFDFCGFEQRAFTDCLFIFQIKLLIKLS